MAERRLRRDARVFHLWAMGSGGGDLGRFFRLEFRTVHRRAGAGPLLAVGVMTLMYVGLCFSHP